MNKSLSSAKEKLQIAKAIETNIHDFRNAFWRKVYLKESPIHTIIVPVCINNCHWGVGIARETTKGRRKYRESFWGDRLGQDTPMGLISSFEQIITASFEDRFIWKTVKWSYMMDILKYKKQSDDFSCGMYVLSLMSECSVHCGVLPSQKFTADHASDLWERYRFSLAECAVKAIVRCTMLSGKEYLNEGNLNYEGIPPRSI